MMNMIERMQNQPGLKKSGMLVGMTMLDILGVLLIGGLLMAGVIGMIRTSIDYHNLLKAQRSLTAMAIEVKGNFAGVGDYTGLTNALVVKNGIVPQELLKGGNIVTPWGGSITLSAGNDGTYTMTWNGLSDKNCTALAIYQPDLWQGIVVNGNTVNPTAAVADANAFCAGNHNTVAFIDR
jgi:hypothetical protein